MMERTEWMAVLARAPEDAMEAALQGVDAGAAQWPRPAETGMIMLEGRAGGAGQRFSLGQATVTRATC
ncbi:MAG: phosphonate C-P lyase system protein PhnG, partial [Paracoccaceae bacterium]